MDFESECEGVEEPSHLGVLSARAVSSSWARGNRMHWVRAFPSKPSSSGFNFSSSGGREQALPPEKVQVISFQSFVNENQ